MTGQLPKAYLRIDPNLDHTHPDPGLFIRLLCAAARQPKRGVFKDVRVLEATLGKRGAQRLVERGDVSLLSDGRCEVDGWEIWQEGDMTVGERMARYRNKRRNSTVTDGVTVPSKICHLPSETVDSKAVDVLGTNGLSSPPATSVQDFASEVLDVLDYWKLRSQTEPKSKKTLDSYRKRIRSRLTEGFSIDDLKRCVDVACWDDFYVKQGYYKQPEVIWRNSERVQTLLVKAQHVAERPLPL